ncbi:hypothetical protein EJ06DRAFT_552731 [Trichodelitschia bisporula]|uniref:Cytochrome c oxidase-assembly factor COX23, mitochondrial n=1 Tax=Trichodelitschia bisporula TaxID=703511 RepID=A0A6G1IAJ1_9PEZI|nr:hypothetical protein EJ06DRAFT_552731 [Trichodelitschia bisporula]
MAKEKETTDEPKVWTEEKAAKFERSVPLDTDFGAIDEFADGRNKAYSKYFDPCQEAASRSLKCLKRNGGDKEMCQDYFEAYRDCKKEWMTQRKEAKVKGLLW